MLGELYEAALAGAVQAEVEHADGTRMPLAVDQWLDTAPGDASLVDRCHGPTLDVGSGPGRLTVALAERGVPALGIDVTPYAVKIAQSSGALAILRDVFGRVPGAGRWMTVLLADGNIGIGGDPAGLLRRISELLAPGGHAFVEVQPPGVPLRCENVRLCQDGSAGAWFPWAYVGTDQIGEVARSAGLVLEEMWSASGRWFAALACEEPAVPAVPPFSAIATVVDVAARTGSMGPEDGPASADLRAEGRLAVLTIHYRTWQSRP